jgi:hypothetical protein
MNTDTFRTLGATSADAAGLSILAGLARPDEGLPVPQGGQGVINHALRVTLPASAINPEYIYPASHMVPTTQGPDKLPLGSRLRLMNTPAIETIISNMPPESQILATAMQQYGLIVADIGTAMYVSGAPASVDANNNINLTWDLTDIFAGNGLEALNAGDFQVVNLTPVVSGLSASSGAPGSTITVNGQNFSGAAGHLSVFFGNTPASSVTIKSDTQLSVVVPNGSGTVDVTVQSGVNETDNFSSNPNANVNAPIFGYGISATTSADVYTFTQATPTIILSTNMLALGSTTEGTAASAQTFTVSGTNLTSDIILTAPAGVEFSSNGSSYTPTLDLAQVGGTVASTIIDARIGISAPKGPVSGTIAADSTGATEQDIAVTGTVNPAVTLSPPALPAGTEGVAYDQTITGSNGTGDKSLDVSNIQNAIPGLYVQSNEINTLNITGTPTGSGTETFTVTATDTVGASAQVSYSITIIPSVATITGVSVQWGTKGSMALQDASGGRLLPAGRQNDLPWFGIDQITITLSQAENLTAADVSVTGMRVANYGPVTVTGAGTTWTIKFAKALKHADLVTVTIGNADITTYTCRLDVLPGDVLDFGIVNIADMIAEAKALNQPYNVFADINGDGSINWRDFLIVGSMLFAPGLP